MDYSIFERNIIGYKNRIKLKGSQDYSYCKKYKDSIIVAIADGHGISRCMFSHIGSEFACKACLEVLTELYDNLKGECVNLSDILDKEDIQINIQNIWREKVNNHYKQIIPNAYKMDYISYGTTLIGALITEKFNLYLQIGDGNILEYENNQFNLIKYKKKNKVKGVVNSMYLDDAYKYIDVTIKFNDKQKKSIVLFSDGYTNSFNSYNQLFNDTYNTILNYKKNVFTKYNIIKGYTKHLEYLTTNKSKDDISIIFVI